MPPTSTSRGRLGAQGRCSRTPYKPSRLLDREARQLDLEVRLAGSEDVAFDIPAVKLAKGTNYSAYAIGSAADGTLQVVLLEDASK
jgi:hypothetical protein